MSPEEKLQDLSKSIEKVIELMDDLVIRLENEKNEYRMILEKLYIFYARKRIRNTNSSRSNKE